MIKVKINFAIPLLRTSKCNSIQNKKVFSLVHKFENRFCLKQTHHSKSWSRKFPIKLSKSSSKPNYFSWNWIQLSFFCQESILWEKSICFHVILLEYNHPNSQIGKVTFCQMCQISSNRQIKWNSSYLSLSVFKFSLTLLHKFYGKTREFSLNLNVFWMLLFHCSFSQQNFFRKLFRRWSQITGVG